MPVSSRAHRSAPVPGHPSVSTTGSSPGHASAARGARLRPQAIGNDATVRLLPPSGLRDVAAATAALGAGAVVATLAPAVAVPACAGAWLGFLGIAAQRLYTHQRDIQQHPAWQQAAADEPDLPAAGMRGAAAFLQMLSHVAAAHSSLPAGGMAQARACLQRQAAGPAGLAPAPSRLAPPQGLPADGLALVAELEARRWHMRRIDQIIDEEKQRPAGRIKLERRCRVARLGMLKARFEPPSRRGAALEAARDRLARVVADTPLKTAMQRGDLAQLRQLRRTASAQRIPAAAARRTVADRPVAVGDAAAGAPLVVAAGTLQGALTPPGVPAAGLPVATPASAAGVAAADLVRAARPATGVSPGAAFHAHATLPSSDAVAHAASDGIHALLRALQTDVGGPLAPHWLQATLSSTFDTQQRTVLRYLADQWRAQLALDADVLQAGGGPDAQAGAMLQALLGGETAGTGLRLSTIDVLGVGRPTSLPGARVLTGDASAPGHAGPCVLLVAGLPTTVCEDEQAVRRQLQQWDLDPASRSRLYGALHPSQLQPLAGHPAATAPRFGFSNLTLEAPAARVVFELVAAHADVCAREAARRRDCHAAVPLQALLSRFPAPATDLAAAADTATVDPVDDLRLRQYSAAARLLAGLQLLPAFDGQGSESAMADVLARTLETPSRSAAPTLLAYLGEAWASRLLATAAQRQASGTLRRATFDLLETLLAHGRADAPPPRAFAVAVQVGRAPPVRLRGAVVVSAHGPHATGDAAPGTVALVLPRLGLIECRAAELADIIAALDRQPVLRAALYDQVPLSRLQPREGDAPVVAWSFPALAAEPVGQQVVDDALQGYLDVARDLHARAQPPRSLQDCAGPALAAPGLIDQALLQLARQHAFDAASLQPAQVPALVQAWLGYLARDLQSAAGPQAAVTPDAFANSQALRRYVADRLRQGLADRGIDIDPGQVSVRWDDIAFRVGPQVPWRDGQGPQAYVAARHDYRLVDLAMRNLAFVDVGFLAGARAFAADGTPVPALTPGVLRRLIRGLDLEQGYATYLAGQFDPSRPGSIGHARLRTFRQLYPERLRVQIAVARAQGGPQQTPMLDELLRRPTSRSICSDGTCMRMDAGPLRLALRPAMDAGIPLADIEVEVPGSLAARRADGRIELYLPGLQPFPVSVFESAAALAEALAGPGMRAGVAQRLRTAKDRDNFNDPALAARLVVENVPGDLFEHAYHQAWHALQDDAGRMITSPAEQWALDAWDLLCGLHAVAEGMLPLRLQLASLALRNLAQIGQAAGASAGDAGARALLAVLDVGSELVMAKAGTRITAAAVPRLAGGGHPSARSGLHSGDGHHYLDTPQGTWRVADTSPPAARGTPLLDPCSGLPGGGRAFYDPARGRWHVEPGRIVATHELDALAVSLDSRTLGRMTTQGNGLHDVDGRQYVRIGGRWLETEVRSELGGGHYLVRPGGRVDPDLMLAAAGPGWVVTRSPHGRLRGGMREDRRRVQVTRRTIQRQVSETRLLEQAEVDRRIAVHGAAAAPAVGAVLRHELQAAARDALLDDISRHPAQAGRLAAQARGRPDMADSRFVWLCALVESTPISARRRIDLYLGSAANGQQRIQIGDGPSPMLRLSSGRTLPALQDLVRALGPEDLKKTLGLPGTASSAEVETALAQRLAQTVGGRREAVAARVDALVDAFDVPSEPVRALAAQFPVTPAQAAEVLQRQPAAAAESLHYAPSTGLIDALADVVAADAETAARTRLVSGSVQTHDDAVLLAGLLDGLLERQHLQAATTADGAPQLRLQGAVLQHTLTFREGRVHAQGGAGPAVHDSWAEAVHAVLDAADRRRFASPGELRERVNQVLATRPVVPPRDIVESRRAELQAAIGSSPCSPGTARCLGSARRPHAGDMQRWETLKQTAVGLRRRCAQALDHDYAEVRRAAWHQLQQTGLFTATLDDPQLDVTMQRFIRNSAGNADLRHGAVKRFQSSHARRDALASANILTVRVELDVDGRHTAFERAYISHRSLSGSHGFAAGDEIRAINLVVPARLKPGHEDAPHVPLEQAFEALEADFTDLMTDRFPFGRHAVLPRVDVGPAGTRGDVQRHAVTLDRLRDEPHRSALLREGYDRAGVQALRIGDVFYRTSIRRCTEAQFLQDLYREIEQLSPGAFSAGRLAGVKLTAHLFSDRMPCLDNCQDLLRGAARKLPGADFKVAYGDPPQGGKIPEHVQPPRFFPLTPVSPREGIFRFDQKPPVEQKSGMEEISP